MYQNHVGIITVINSVDNLILVKRQTFSQRGFILKFSQTLRGIVYFHINILSDNKYKINLCAWSHGVIATCLLYAQK